MLECAFLTHCKHQIMMKLSPTALGVTLLTGISTYTFANPIDAIQQSQQIKQQQDILQQQREQQLRQMNLPEQDVRLPEPSFVPDLIRSHDFSKDELCFPIQNVSLMGEESRRFQFALKRGLKELGFKHNQCMSSTDINRLMGLVQNHIIGRGYTTTRVLAAPQNLQTGKLELTLMAGYIKDFKVNQSQSEQTHAGRIAAFQNEFPTNRKKLLNLRELEQGLENLKRLPTAEANIQIVPTDKPNESNIAIDWQQRLVPFRGTLSLDDSGSKSTGKLQGNMTLSADNPLGLSDMAYVSVGRGLGNIPDLKNSDGKTIKGKTHNYALHYSVPFGKWTWSVNHSRYRYHQAVAGYQENYDYSGESSSSDVGFNRLLYRDGKRKTHFGAKLWQKETRSYIDDAELDVQKRKTAGWGIDFNHKEYLDDISAQLKVAYKRGTGMNGALPAPEEAFGEGTSRMKIITADLNVNIPFQIKKQKFAYDTSLHAQWNKTPLTPQDKMAIGGRYSVRGFDGEMSLAAERGVQWRNELSWQYAPQHQVYLAADVGHVSGPSAQYLLGQTLAGGAIGLRGQFKAGGALSYDVFASKAIKKPEFFQTKNTTTGFSLNYSF